MSHLPARAWLLSQPPGPQQGSTAPTNTSGELSESQKQNHTEHSFVRAPVNVLTDKRLHHYAPEIGLAEPKSCSHRVDQPCRCSPLPAIPWTLSLHPMPSAPGLIPLALAAGESLPLTSRAAGLGRYVKNVLVLSIIVFITNAY